MIAQLCPADRLPKLVHGANSAGQGDKAIGQTRKGSLAFMHGANHDQLGAAMMRHLGRLQRPGDDADHLATLRQRRIGQRAHQPQPAAAINNANAAPRQFAPHRGRQRQIALVGRRGRPAINRQPLHRRPITPKSRS